MTAASVTTLLGPYLELLLADPSKPGPSRSDPEERRV